MPNASYCRPIGRPRLTKTEDGRLRVTRRFSVRADSTDPANLDTRVFDAYLTADVKYTSCLLVQQYTSEAPDQSVEVVLVQVFEQITGTATRVGDIQAGIASPRAFVDTNGSGVIVAATRFAREWSVNYVLTGDVSASDGAWLAVSATLLFGLRTGYLTSTSVLAKANGYSLVRRVYTEQPSKLVYGQRGQYTFPALLGYDSDLGPYIAAPSTTREVTFSIEETYHVGEPSATALGYEPIYWAQGIVNYTRSTGEEGAKAFNFPGAIGNVTISMSNRVFAGYLCSSVAGTVASSPTTYPTGAKIISSRISPWRGDIWIRRNVSVTFP
jgi:hypothetical protein